MTSTKNKKNLRYERKFFSSDADAAQILAYLKAHPSHCRSEYPDRFINNIYLDTPDLAMYRHGLDGNPHRVKVRLRWYGPILGDSLSPTLEIKRKFGHVGDKLRRKMPTFPSLQALVSAAKTTRDILHEESADFPLTDTIFSGLRPVLMNRYRRRYWVTADRKARITVDTNVHYFPPLRGGRQLTNPVEEEKAIVVEVKYLPEHHDDVDEITSKMPIRMSKISKYLHGVDLLRENRHFFM